VVVPAADDDTTVEELVDGLVRLLDLEPIEENIFRGVSPDISLQRVFGGQVAGQALVAAGRTVPEDRPVHSLHSYFIRPGDPAIPIVYAVDRVRDGRSFTTRRVVAIQHGRPIFTLSASFQLRQDGIDHQVAMPDTPAPETFPTVEERYGDLRERPAPYRIKWPFDVRYVDEPSWEQRSKGPRDEGQYRIWIRAAAPLPDEALVHVCAVTFISDLTLLDSVLVHHGLAPGVDPVRFASLDHAMWFHRPFRADEWFLYAQGSPSASGGRGLATGRIFSRDGRLLVSVVQEGMVRIPSA
jgi:acyl-CoA thioesterase II